jgi:large repetitive protein
MATATLKWTAPTTRTDGTPLSPDTIASTDIFDSNSVTPLVPIGTVLGAAITFVTGVLTVGVHNFTVVVTDTSGHVSAASNVASVTVPATLANPSAVTDLTAVLNPDVTGLPTIVTVSPNTGASAGGTSVTITGANLRAATSVTFGGVEASGVTAVDETALTVITPAMPAGTVDVVVVTPAGKVASVGAYIYT